jgi:excisionase family DNA binding protein
LKQPDEPLISTTEVAKLLGVTNDTVLIWSRDPDNSFPAPALVGHSGRVYRWRRADVMAWLAAQAEAADVA